MKKLQKNQIGFTGLEVLLAILALAIVGFAGYYIYHMQNKTGRNSNSVTTSSSSQSSNKKTTAQDQQSAPGPSATSVVANTTGPNAGYLVVKEWGLRFKQPSGLTDVTYVIVGNTLAFYAKPVGSDVQYRNNYTALSQGTPEYALGLLFRSTDNPATQENGSGSPTQAEKIGDYYYDTAWAFDSTASSAACVGLYAGSSNSDCSAEAIAFPLVNQGDTTLLNTIGLAQ